MAPGAARCPAGGAARLAARRKVPRHHLHQPVRARRPASSPRRISAHLGASRRTSAHLGAPRRTSAHLGAPRRTSAHLGAPRRTSAHLRCEHVDPSDEKAGCRFKVRSSCPAPRRQHTSSPSPSPSPNPSPNPRWTRTSSCPIGRPDSRGRSCAPSRRRRGSSSSTTSRASLHTSRCEQVRLLLVHNQSSLDWTYERAVEARPPLERPAEGHAWLVRKCSL